MGEQEYNTYLDAIRRFLVSGAAKKFYVSSFVELLLEGTGLSSISKGGVKP
jgi:hypothetical protein